MGEFPIQPQAIEIPEDDPFKHDLLNRKEIGETLTRLVGSIQGSCVLAVDAPWGAGKTTFLRMWSQYLRDKQFPVVDFNAWESDYSNEPFTALCTGLSMDLRDRKDDKLTKKIAEMEKAAQVLFQLLSLAISSGTGGVVNIYPIFAPKKEKPAETDRFDEYRKATQAIEDFKAKLEELAEELFDENCPGPLVVMIDELDRCRPSYAVEFLETAKHLFAVDQVVFVLAMNLEQLSHAVKVVYGHDFDAEGYLRRFVDIDFRLPDPKRDVYITQLFTSTGVDRAINPIFRSTLQTFFDSSPLSLRDIAQAIYRFGLVLKSFSDEHPMIAKYAVIALIMRSLDKTTYYQFVNKEISDSQAAKEIFGITSIKQLRWENYGILFQAVIIKAYKELSGRKTPTPLENEIRKYINGIENEDVQQEKRIVLKDAFDELKGIHGTKTDFMDAYKHIELFMSGNQ